MLALALIFRFRLLVVITTCLTYLNHNYFFFKYKNTLRAFKRLNLDLSFDYPPIPGKQERNHLCTPEIMVKHFS